ncbi:MAG: protein phosphatase 2C domain-containing protein [Gammaproteobacteria bacterium]|nr:protein phosphatase 2C domain-containing protein [Gammaproteobacteria bacterium]
MQYLTATASLLGNRSKNQDRVAIYEKLDTVLLVLGDGLGGRPGGELAAQTLVDTAAEAFTRQSIPIKDPVGFMQQTLETAHQRIVKQGQSQTPPINPGTTAVLCLMQQGLAWWSHVGDSRLYLFRNGVFVERTQDHSVVENMLAGGKLDTAMTGNHPLRNVVTRCLGMSENPPIITMSQKVELKPGDIMLLCSDGFWEPLGEKTMAKFLFDGRLQDSLDQMATRAENIKAPESDNVSAIALQVMSIKLRTRSLQTKKKAARPNSLRAKS